MSLHPHQHAALVELLRQERFADLSPDDAYTLLASDKNFLGLRSLCFVPQAKYDRTPVKRRDRLTVADDATAAAFPGGIPGFPNKLLREWFDAAWQEARG